MQCRGHSHRQLVVVLSLFCDGIIKCLQYSSVHSCFRYSKVPLFVTKPRSTEAVEGDTVIIHCEVVGDPKPEVMWLRDWLKVGFGPFQNSL